MTNSAVLIRQTFPVGHFQCNGTIIGDRVSKKVWVIDRLLGSETRSNAFIRVGGRKEKPAL